MSPSLHLVFCGTPSFAVPTLNKLVEAGFPVSLVVTQPDRPRGRGLELTHSPVKTRALELGLQIVQPPAIKQNEAFHSQLAAIHPDAIVVVGYGRIIPQWMIDLPRFGNLNLHASLLPKYRGAAPVQWAIACGENVTGLTTMRIDAGLDTGDILLQKALSIEPDDTAETLSPRLAVLGADLTLETMQRLAAGTLSPRPQDHSQATLAPILRREDGRVDFQRTAREICNRLRGFQPWPGAFTTFRGKNLQLLSAYPSEARVAPGQLAILENRLIVGCGQSSALELFELQLEGKRRMPAQDFIHGYRPQPGEQLGSS